MKLTIEEAELLERCLPEAPASNLDASGVACAEQLREQGFLKLEKVKKVISKKDIGKDPYGKTMHEVTREEWEQYVITKEGKKKLLSWWGCNTR